jgi:sulfur-oxidizing protein SoxX
VGARAFDWRAARNCLAVLAVMTLAFSSRAGDLSPAMVVADTIPTPFTATPGDPAAGRALLLKRENANCILCHAIPDARFSGNLAPPLSGIGSRLSAAQLRLRVVDNSQVHPDTIMPSYYRTTGLTDVAAQYRGKTVLTAREVEDLVAYLETLK